MTTRPSASVFMTSTVLPPYIVMTSDGRMAVPEGMFSASASQPVTFTGTSRAAAARTTAKTVAAPAMSDFIVIIEAAGFSEMPPVSKVMPLPTSAMCAAASAGACSMRTSRGGREEPWPIARMPPKPSARRRSSSHTSTLTDESARSSATASANVAG